jgi:uncharacterized protein (DUF1330 family)
VPLTPRITTMPAAYVIVDLQITDPERFKAYMAAAPATIRAAGGEYLVRGGRFETLEGDWHPSRLTVLRFPNMTQAKAWYDGELYRQAMAEREGATAFFNMNLVEGVDAPPA